MRWLIMKPHIDLGFVVMAETMIRGSLTGKGGEMCPEWVRKWEANGNEDDSQAK